MVSRVMNDIARFELPVSDADRHVIADCLASSDAVFVGQFLLTRDLSHNLIWGTDPFGVDFVAAQRLHTGDCLKAIERVVAMSLEQVAHPAEFSS